MSSIVFSIIMCIDGIGLLKNYCKPSRLLILLTEITILIFYSILLHIINMFIYIICYNYYIITLSYTYMPKYVYYKLYVYI